MNFLSRHKSQDNLAEPQQNRGRLVFNYFIVSVILVAGGLITSGIVELYFRYRESHEHFAQLQREIASGAAYKIEDFVHDLIGTADATTKSRDIAEKGLTKEYRFELKRLLYRTPAIMEATAYDLNGIMQAQSSRFPVSPGDEGKLSSRTAFRQAASGKSYISQVYFFKDSEPYITIALPIERFPGNVVGVLLAEVNLKYVGEVISNIKVGKSGYSYVVNGFGDLIAHPDMSLVLQHRNLSHLSQVKAAFSIAADAGQRNMMVKKNLRGLPIIYSSAVIPTLGWAVLVERPSNEAHQFIFSSVSRSAGVLVVGFGMALLASVLLARRVIRPLRALRDGAKHIGRGNLSARLELSTGDEFESLAEEFNRMAASLEAAKQDMERKIRDRTEDLAIANKKLQEASQHKSAFLANVNHELRTPVSAIIGFTRLLLRKTEGQIGETEREKLQKTMATAEHLLDVINGLLDLSKIEAGQMDLFVEPFKVEEVVQSACSTVEPMMNGHVRLVREIAPNLPALNTDRSKLEQIIVNLLSNAVKFTEQGTVKISAARQSGSLELVVSDTGIGIEKEALDHIFEEFRQGDKSSVRKFGGTGLGLAIVRKLASLLGGEIAVESELGKGSAFTVTLPWKLEQNRRDDADGRTNNEP